MSFDMGFNFRNTAGFVTDPAYCVPVLSESYPNTYTNSNGQSVNAGWQSVGGVFNQNLSTAVDPRLAGDNYALNAETVTFKVDLSSGSAPGAGTYTVDLALGDEAAARNNVTLHVNDNATPVITVGPVNTTANHYYDASGTLEAPGTGSWDLVHVTQSEVFSSTIASVDIFGNGENPTLAHFRLTLQTAVTGSVQHLFTLLGVGA